MIEVIKQIAREAGEVVLKYYKGDFEVNSKSDDYFNPVTTADLESDKVLHARLEEEFPDMQVLSEENIKDNIDWSKKVWVIDPIDGTLPFTKHLDYWCVLIGLIDNGESVLGVMYFPVLGEMYWSEKGKGAFLEKDDKVTKLQVSDTIELSKARFYGDRSALAPAITLGADRVADSDCGGAHTAALLKAEIDFYVRSPSSGKWDCSALNVMIEEAGGKATTSENNVFDFGQADHHIGTRMVYSNSVIHDKVLEALDKSKD